MDSLRSHPRRRFLNDAPSAPTLITQGAVLSNPSNQQLKKSATFHSPTTPPSQDEDPILNIPSLPRRSPTCRKDLEDAMATGDDRLAHLLGAVDRSLSGLESFSSRGQNTSLAEDLPVPRFLLNPPIADNDRMDVDHASDVSRATTPQPHRKHHTSDSGIGSTISSSESSMPGDYAGMKQALHRHNPSYCSAKAAPSIDECRSQTGINGVAAPTAASSASQHALSEYACRQIHKYIILPITREEKLKDFHPLVNGIPYRVARKEITCLRDLEKVLLWLAPKWSVSKASFLNFCNTSIQCIHTAVEHLNDHDQRRPTDRPYTNGYFLDLVEQVQQYAAMLAASRSEECAKGDEKMATEKLSLVGGLSQTGRPAELVRTKDGQSISLSTGEVLSVDSKVTDVRRLKRPMSEDSDDDDDDDDAIRSMARRRKSAQPIIKEVLKCRDCARIFKRPCDLTKHEKTHSRPWKCHDVSCKYHELGWPTEKERDRHVNDKHSAEPPKYKCQFSPCPYESKRESNCKQHMEKAHGWTYVRSKNNGKVPRKAQSSKTPPTPQISTPGSSMFEMPTPDIRQTFASPYSGSVSGSILPLDESTSYVKDHVLEFDETFGAFNPDLSWNGSNDDFGNNPVSEYTNGSHRPSWDAASSADPLSLTTPFESLLTPQDVQQDFLDNFDWSNMGNMDNDYQSMNVQLFTPAASVDNLPYVDSNRNNSSSFEQAQKIDIQSFSPGAQENTMLYSPFSNHANDFGADETYGDFTSDIQKSAQDFTLYSDSNVPSVTSSLINQNLARQFGMSDLMDHE